jgi:hypothetical protein
LSTRRLRTQNLFNDVWNGVYTQVGIKSPQQDAVLVGAKAFNQNRYDLISILVMKEDSFLTGDITNGVVVCPDEYVGAGMFVQYIPGEALALDRDDYVVANFALAVPGDYLGLSANFKRDG